jgi:hypothetical protein
MGGFAEDALLGGEITHDRADIDLLVDKRDWEALRDELGKKSVAGFAPIFLGPSSEPIAFGSRLHGITVEVWLASRDEDGHSIVLPGDGSWFRLRLPADTFDFPRAYLEDVPVQTVSPSALCVFRAVSAQTRGDERRRAEDRRMLDRLAVLLPGLATARPPQIELLQGSDVSVTPDETRRSVGLSSSPKRRRGPRGSGGKVVSYTAWCSVGMAPSRLITRTGMPCRRSSCLTRSG